MVHTSKKGFTLIELLIVIGILAVLATAIILILNPAQLFAQARDSQRISDLATMKSALAFYLSTVSATDLGDDAKCYVYASPTSGSMGANCDGRHSASRATTVGATLSVDGLGWIPVDFGAIAGGAPLSVLPKDPRNTGAYFYSYTGNDLAKTFEMNANMESGRYGACGSDDVETSDGGNKGVTSDCPSGASIADAVYEVGNEPGLDL